MLLLSSKLGRTRATRGFKFASLGVLVCRCAALVHRYVQHKTLCSDSGAGRPDELRPNQTLRSKILVKITSSSQWRKSRGCTKGRTTVKRLTAVGVKGRIWTRLCVGRMQVNDETHSMKTFWKMLCILYLQTSLSYLAICPLPQFHCVCSCHNSYTHSIGFYHRRPKYNATSVQSSGQDVALTDTDGSIGGVFQRVTFGWRVPWSSPGERY